MCLNDAVTREPADEVLERLNDPGVAEAMLRLLDDLPTVHATLAAVGRILARGDDLAAALVEELETAGTPT